MSRPGRFRRTPAEAALRRQEKETPVITRKLDQRKRATPFIQEVGREISRMINRRTPDSSPLSTMTRAISKTAGTARTFRSTDSRNGVVVVTNLSDIPATRRQVERILGVPARVIHADTLGTVYAPEA